MLEEDVEASAPDLGPSTDLTLNAIRQMIDESEIDFRGLEERISKCLETSSQISLEELLELYPSEQGLGTAGVGYLLGNPKGTPDGRRGQNLPGKTENNKPAGAAANGVIFERVLWNQEY